MNSPAGRTDTVRWIALSALALVTFTSTPAIPVAGQLTDDPYPDPIPQSEGVIRVNYVEFAAVPDFDGRPPRMMHLVDEPGTDRMFVSDMWGVLYSVGYDGSTVTEYLDLTEPECEVRVEASGSERGFQSFAFHPQFGEAGAAGYGKLYTPLASPGDSDFGLLYMGVADGGSGGDPMDLARDLSSAFGKLFRIDPLGSNSANGE